MEKTEAAFTPEDRIGALELQNISVLDNRALLLHCAQAIGHDNSPADVVPDFLKT